MGPFYAGLFAVLRRVGVFVAPLAGILSDRHGSNGVTRVGIAAVVMAFPLMAFVPGFPGLIFGVAAWASALQLAMISQQSNILRLDDTLRAPVNTIYVAALSRVLRGFAGGQHRLGKFGWWGIWILGTAVALPRWPRTAGHSGF